MSLNFPTAFWKKQPESVSTTNSLTWETGLAWTHQIGMVGTSPDFEDKQGTQAVSSYPFLEYDNGGAQADFWTLDTFANSFYPENVSAGDQFDVNTWNGERGTTYGGVLYGFYLHGGNTTDGEPNDLSSIHRGNPFDVSLGGSGLKFYFETDAETDWEFRGEYDVTKYNRLVQSGEATGTLTLAGAGDLHLTVSGLGMDYLAGITANTDYFYDIMEVYVDGSILTSGRAPCDEIHVSEGSYYQEQVKLFDGGSSTIINPGTPSTVGYPATNGGTMNPTVNAGGTGQFSTSLGAGSHEIVVKFSSMWGCFTSGAFYGLDFKIT
jgi:hypothetical protein